MRRDSTSGPASPIVISTAPTASTRNCEPSVTSSQLPTLRTNAASTAKIPAVRITE